MSMSNSLEAQASSGYILFWELCDVKILYVVFDSITSFLVANDHMLENTAEGRDSTTLMFWNAGQIRLYFRMKSLLRGQAKDVIQPVVAFNLDFCAVTKDELLPRKVVVVAKVLPIDDGILELFGLSNFVWSGEIDTLRDHDDRGHIVLEDKTMDAVEDGLPSDGIFGNVVVICLDTGEHSTEVPRRDLSLESLDYLASCLLARDRVIPTVLLTKDNLTMPKVLIGASRKRDLKAPFVLKRRDFARGICLPLSCLMIRLKELVVELCLFGIICGPVACLRFFIFDRDIAFKKSRWWGLISFVVTSRCVRLEHLEEFFVADHGKELRTIVRSESLNKSGSLIR